MSRNPQAPNVLVFNFGRQPKASTASLLQQASLALAPEVGKHYRHKHSSSNPKESNKLIIKHVEQSQDQSSSGVSSKTDSRDTEYCKPERERQPFHNRVPTLSTPNAPSVKHLHSGYHRTGFTNIRHQQGSVSVHDQNSPKDQLIQEATFRQQQYFNWNAKNGKKHKSSKDNAMMGALKEQIEKKLSASRSQLQSDSKSYFFAGGNNRTTEAKIGQHSCSSANIKKIKNRWYQLFHYSFSSKRLEKLFSFAKKRFSYLGHIDMIDEGKITEFTTNLLAMFIAALDVLDEDFSSSNNVGETPVKERSHAKPAKAHNVFNATAKKDDNMHKDIELNNRASIQGKLDIQNGYPKTPLFAHLPPNIWQQDPQSTSSNNQIPSPGTNKMKKHDSLEGKGFNPQALADYFPSKRASKGARQEPPYDIFAERRVKPTQHSQKGSHRAVPVLARLRSEAIGSSKNISGFVESPSANDGSPVEIIRSAINQTPVKRELSFNPPENNDTFAKNSKEQDSHHKLRNSSASSKRQKVSKIKYFDIALEKRSKSSSQQRNSHDV